MVKISDHDIDVIIDLVSFYYDRNKCFRGNLRKEYLLRDLHGALHNKQAGTHEGVCQKCLGTGYESES